MVKVAARTRAASQPAGAAAAPGRFSPAQAAAKVAPRPAARRCLPQAVRGAAGLFANAATFSLCHLQLYLQQPFVLHLLAMWVDLRSRL